MSDFNADEMRKVIEAHKEAVEKDGGFPGVGVNKTAESLMLDQIESNVRSSAGAGRNSTTISVNSVRTAQEVRAKDNSSVFSVDSFRHTAVEVVRVLVERGFECKVTMPRTVSADFNIIFSVVIPRA